jgi:hypothetical protein
MKKKETKGLISALRKCRWSKICLFLMVANFINLSANFYEANISISEDVDMVDPIDTVSELIFEWAMEGSEDIIPDNGTEQEDNSLEKIKLSLFEIQEYCLFSSLIFEEFKINHFRSELVSGHFSSDSPPPDGCRFFG